MRFNLYRARWITRLLVFACLGARPYSQAQTPDTTGAVKTFNVQAFGAVADNTADDQAAIEKALSAANQWTKLALANHATVYFPAGTYNLTNYHKLFAINVIGMRNITITGAASKPGGGYPTELVGAPAGYYAARHAPFYNSFFNISGSQDIVIANFGLRKQVPYFTQGVIRAVNVAGHSVDVGIDPGYRDLNDPYVANLLKLIWFFSAPDHSIWDHGAAACAPPVSRMPGDFGCYNNHILSHQLLSPGLWRLGLDKPPSATYLNVPFLMWGNLGWQSGIMIDHSINVTVQNIFYTGGGGPAVHIQFSAGNNIIRNFRVDVPAGSNALFAATSGFNGGSNRGTITLDNVHVAHVDDDAFHFGDSTYFPVLNADPTGSHIRLALCYDGSFKPGDEVSLWNWSQKQEVARAHVVSTNIVEDTDVKKFPRTCDVVLDRGLGAIHNLRSYDPHRLGIEEDHDDRILNLSFHPHLTVENSYFSSMRARCGIIQMSAEFDNNTCQNTAMAGLLIGPEFSWGEGYNIDNVVIENSKFDNIGGTAVYIASIENSAHTPTYDQLATIRPSANTAQSNTNISVNDNEFSNLGHFQYGVMGLRGAAITIENARHVQVQRNKVSSADATNSDTKTPIVVSPFTTSDVVVQNP